MNKITPEFREELADSMQRNSGKICFVTIGALLLAVSADAQNLPPRWLLAGLSLRLTAIFYFFLLYSISKWKPKFFKKYYDIFLTGGATYICLGVSLIGLWAGKMGATYFFGILEVEFAQATFLTVSNPFFLFFALTANVVHIASMYFSGQSSAAELANIGVSMMIFFIVSIMTNYIVLSYKFQNHQQRYRLKSILESISDAFMALDRDFHLTYLNPEAMKLFSRDGKGMNELLGRTIWEIYPALVNDSLFYEKSLTAMNTRQPQIFEEFFPRFNGYLEMHMFPSEAGLSIYAHEITDRKIAEENLRKSLAEKDVLLRHIHHGVKNNLQMISSLLSLQAGKFADTKEKDALLEGQNRIRAIAFVHETLYQSNDLTAINFKTFVDSIASSLRMSYGATDRVELDIDVPSESLDVEKAIFCGLVLNELLTNSFKYAFAKGNRGRIRIFMENNGHLRRIFVEDNGVGFPEDIDIENSKSIGLKLVRLIVERQLGGTLKINGTDGVKAVFEFSGKDRVD